MTFKLSMKEIHELNEIFTEAWSKIRKQECKWWVNYLYHFTNMDNALSILETGCIYSRNRAVELNLMKNDNADPEVLINSNHTVKDKVRLYFRPRTPTQYRNEGYRAILENNYHVPVPVFFLFRVYDIFGNLNVEFTNSHPNTTGCKVYNDFKDLRKINFSYLYHDEPTDEINGRKIRGVRQAEVWVKEELPIKYLNQIILRSEADRETLLYELSCNRKITEEMYKEVRDKLLVKKSLELFYNKGSHIDFVTLTDKSVNVTVYNSSANYHKPLRIILDDGHMKYKFEKNLEYMNNYEFEFDFLQYSDDMEFIVTIYIGETKMYKNQLAIRRAELL